MLEQPLPHVNGSDPLTLADILPCIPAAAFLNRHPHPDLTSSFVASSGCAHTTVPPSAVIRADAASYLPSAVLLRVTKLMLTGFKWHKTITGGYML